MKSGIAVAGSILVDKINEISAYPNAGELTQIRSVKKAVGGGVPNVAIDLKRICPDLTVKAVGRVGDDENGKYVTEVFGANGVECSGVTLGTDATSFTEVMSITGGQRTFFTFAGANGTFGFEDVNWEKLNVKMFHLGYFLLLDKVDEGDGLKLLQEAKKRGMKTSIDLVSENSNRYACVLPCLPFVDNLIVNETEAGKMCGVEANEENLVEVAQKLLEMGVNERVILHTPKTAVCVSKQKVTQISSYVLPKGYIKGTTGAGDAFCSGALVAIYEGRTDEEILQLAQMAAVASLSQPDATSGVKEEALLKKSVEGFARG